MNNKMRGFIDPFTLSLTLVIALVGATTAIMVHKDNVDNVDNVDKLSKSEQPIEATSVVTIDTNQSVID